MRKLALLLALISLPAQAVTPATVVVTFDRTSMRTVVAEGAANRDVVLPDMIGPVEHRVTADDPVRIASISKLVTALGVMRLVDQGKLDLDADVSRYLGFHLRHPAFPDRVITLRLLLSHQSGLLDGDDLYIIPLGTTLEARLADPRVWDSAHAPGSGWFHYTNLNFPVVASVMERVTGERFDVLMSRLVLKPLRLDACFNWGAGCSAGAFASAVVLYRADGSVARDDLRGHPPICPVMAGPDGCDLSRYRPGENGALFSPQGGLRISMNDLARIGQMLARRGKNFLSPRAYAALTRPAWTFDGRNGVGENGAPDGFFCQYGLALHTIGGKGAGCHDDLFGDSRRRIGHAGDAYGLKSGLWLNPVSGKGIAYFTSAVPDDAPKGRSAFLAIEEATVERALFLPRAAR